MPKKPTIFFLCLFVLMALAGLTARNYPAPQAAVNKLQKLAKPGQLPNPGQEIDPSTAAIPGQAICKKNTGSPDQFRSVAWSKSRCATTPLPVKPVALRSKDYLRHIYPSQNFW